MATVEQTAAKLSQEQGINIQAAREAVASRPEAYGVTPQELQQPDATHVAESIAQSTGIGITAARAAVEAHPEKYGITPTPTLTLTSKTPETTAVEIAQNQGIGIQAAREVVSKHPEHFNLPSEKDRVTGILPNVGWVQTKQGAVYDPEAYAQKTQHTPGYYGFKGYGGEIGKEPTLPDGWKSMSPKAQFDFAVENGLIPKGAQFVKGSKTNTWGYLTPEQVRIIKKANASNDKKLSKNQIIEYLNRVASPDFLENGGTGKERMALDNAIVAAGFKMKSGVGAIEWNKLTNAERAKVAEYFIAPTEGIFGFGVLGEGGFVSNKLTEIRSKVSKYTGSEAEPPRAITVAYLDQIADYDFFKNGGTVKERNALVNAMRTAGFSPDVDAYRKLSAANKRKVASVMEFVPSSKLIETYIDKPVAEFLDNLETKAANVNNPVLKVLANLAAGTVSFVTGGTLAPVSTSVKTISDIAEGYPKHAVAQALNLPIGMVEWAAVHVPQLIINDPVAGVSYAIGALSAPYIPKAVKSLKIQTVEIPTTEGVVKTWQGLTVSDRMTIGMSRGKLTLGGRNITLPEASKIIEGYEPISVVETKVFVDPARLEKAGFSKTEVNKLVQTLKVRDLLAGRKSPYLDPDVLLEPTKYITGPEMEAMLKILNEHSREFKSADLLYGSKAIKAQLEPGLRGWRELHDIDIRMNLSTEATAKFTQEVLSALKKSGRGKYRISPESPTLIEKWQDGKWHHIADIHSKEYQAGYPVAAEGAYGLLHGEVPVTITVPGVGKFDIMTLSESGKRKFASISEVREGGFSPAAHRTKDIADFVVIVDTLLGEKVAGDMAKQLGYTLSELKQKAAANPIDIEAITFSPHTGRVSPRIKNMPVISLNIPSAIAPSLTPAMIDKLSKPISPKKLSPSQLSSVKDIITSPIGSASVSTSPSTSPTVSISPSASPSVSTSISSKTSVSTSPSISPAASVSPSASPSISPSPSAASKSGASPSLVSSPRLTTIRPPVKVTSSAPRLVTPVVRSSKSMQDDFNGAIAWRQGFGWYVIKSPYKSIDDVAFFRDAPPPGAKVVKGGAGSALRSIQALAGDVPDKLTVDLGIMDVKIKNPARIPGKRGAIVYRRDTRRSTTGDISIGTRRGKMARQPQKVKGASDIVITRGQRIHYVPRNGVISGKRRHR